MCVYRLLEHFPVRILDIVSYRFMIDLVFIVLYMYINIFNRILQSFNYCFYYFINLLQ